MGKLITKSYLVMYTEFDLLPKSKFNDTELKIYGYFKTYDLFEFIENFKSLGKDKFHQICNRITIPMAMRDLIELYISNNDSIKILVDKDQETFKPINNINCPNYLVNIVYETSGFDANNEIEHSKVIDIITKYVDHVLSEQGFTDRIMSITSIASTKEFPEDIYYLYDYDKKDGLTKLPIDDILARNAKAISHKYTSIANFSNLETSETFVYTANDDKHGNSLINFLKEYSYI